MPINRVKKKDGDLLVAVDLNTFEPGFDPKKHFKAETPEESAVLGRVTELWYNATKNIDIIQRRLSNEKKGKVEHDKDRHLTRIGALTEMFDLMQENITKQSIMQEQPDVLVEIPRNLCHTFEFHKSKELIEFGRMRAKEALDRLVKEV